MAAEKNEGNLAKRELGTDSVPVASSSPNVQQMYQFQEAPYGYSTLSYKREKDSSQFQNTSSSAYLQQNGMYPGYVAGLSH